MSRRGDNIHKRKDGRWEGRYRCGKKPDNTPRYHSVYASTYTACKAKLAEAAAQIANGHYTWPPMTFGDAAQHWLTANQLNLKGSTKMKYRDMLNKHLLPTLGNLSLAKLDAATINAFLEKKQRCGGIKNGKPLASSYVKTMAIIIEATLHLATVSGWCAPLKAPINKPIVPRSEIAVLSKQEEADLTKILLQTRSETALGTLLALQAGLRIGEVCALRWCDIDFEGGLVHICHTVSRTLSDRSEKTVLIVDCPKTRSSYRIVPIPPPLQHVLLAAYQKRQSEYVVSDTNTFVGTRTFDYRYRALLKKNNITPVGFHVLRHTYATRCAEAGIDAKTLSTLLGHASSATTLNIYVHPCLELAKHRLATIYYSA